MIHFLRGVFAHRVSTKRNNQNRTKFFGKNFGPNTQKNYNRKLENKTRDEQYCDNENRTNFTTSIFGENSPFTGKPE
jgi:hypothetical protein